MSVILSLLQDYPTEPGEMHDQYGVGGVLWVVI